MDDAAFVRMGQSVGDLHPVADDTLRGQPVGGDERTEGLPLDMFHDDKGLALVFTDLVDGADVGMIQGRGGAGLLEEPGRGFRVLLRQHLDGDRALERRVVSLIDLGPMPPSPMRAVTS